MTDRNRLFSASVVADVDPEPLADLDNDETRPLTVDSFGGDIGEQVRECIERPLRKAIFGAGWCQARTRRQR